MGTWFVQRQVPALAALEAGARSGVEKYEWDDADNCISVQYTFNRAKASDDDVTTVQQRGWVVSEQGTEWAVSPKVGPFFLPARLPFIIVDVDPEAYMICSGGLDSWMYVMTRDKQPGEALLDACMSTVEAAGFDMSKVLVMEQP